MFQKLKGFLFENKTVKQTVAKNTVWLTISNFGGRLLKSAIVIYADRALGTAGYGLFSYTVTLAGFLTLFMDPGINATITKEGARSGKENSAELLSTTAIMKVILILLGLFVVIFLGPLFTTLPGARALLPVVGVIIVFDTIRDFLLAFVRSMEKMEWEAGIFLFTNLAIVTCGFLFILARPTAKSLGWGYALGTGLGAMAAIIVLSRYTKNIFSRFSSRLSFSIIRSAWPFAAVSALGALLTNADILIISWMRSASDVGVYSAAIRIIQVLYLVPTVVQFSTLPLFSRLANRDNEKFRVSLERVISVVFLISIPLALGGVILGTEIMRVIFGPEYTAGALSFKILMLTMLVDYPAAIIGNALFAYEHQRSLIVSTAIAGTVNVVFDLLFIPRFGIAGSAVATLIAQALGNWYIWRSLKRINEFNVFPHLKKIAASAVGMAILTLVLFSLHVNVAVNILLSAVLYFLLLKYSGEPLLPELMLMIGVGGGRKTPQTTAP